MEHNIEIRIEVQTNDGVTVEDWKEYCEALITALRAANDWASQHKTHGFKIEAYETSERKEVTHG